MDIDVWVFKGMLFCFGMLYAAAVGVPSDGGVSIYVKRGVDD